MGDNFDGHLLEHLREIEEAAEEVLSEKQEIVDLDRKRNQNREAIRALSRPQENSSNESNDKAWLAMGNCFFELPKKKALNLLEQDQVKLDSEINSLRSDIKVKVNNLRDKEGKSELTSFNLKAMNKEEMAAVRQGGSSDWDKININ